ncbi:MAG: carboxypeptidase-like regulatory domain-containing protein, partial [Candidatus Micrarchaeota archaeon]
MGLYRLLEEKYYHFMDWLEDSLHIPVYKYFVEPIEKQGTPSFPVFLALLFSFLVLVSALVLFFFNPFPPAGLTVSVFDEGSGSAIAGATVKLLNAEGGTLAEKLTDDAGKAVFEGVAIQAGYSVSVVKAGFKAVSETLEARQDQLSVFLELYVKPIVTPQPPTVSPSPSTWPDTEGVVKVILKSKVSGEVLTSVSA